MFLKRDGFPEEGELVFCTVTKIQYHAITVQLDEYDKQGLIPISEVSPGRIRNIREFVEEGKKIVCKVIKSDSMRGQIDVSLRRVNESQKRNKTDSIKQEQKAEKIISSLSEKLKKPAAELYRDVASKIMKTYPWIYVAFDQLVEHNVSLETYGIEKSLAKELEAVVRDKIKPKQVSIVEKISIKTYNENGLQILKDCFAKGKEVEPAAEFSYLGGGSFRLLVVAKDYKKAEGSISGIKDAMTKEMGKKGTLEFARQEA
jgi:translation initiation factor 2 subunit 1